MTQTLSCPKCHGEMLQGHVMSIAPGGVAVSLWTEGEPVGSSFFGFKLGKFAIAPQMQATTIPIGTFRCGSCGYLESYARDEFAPK